MSINQVKSEIRRFLESDERLALCLSGKWGVGKTYTWDMLLAEAIKNETASPARYAYVSLFGLESLGDVRRSLFENTVEAAAFKSSEPMESRISGVSDRLAQLASKWRAGVGMIRGIPVVADYSSLAEKAGFLDVRNQIVCFDDLERISESLPLKDVLGLVSLLKEKKKCKVVLLLNEEALKGEDAEDFKVQLEKIIDISLVFSPTAREAAEIAVSEDKTVLAEWVSHNTMALGISNIRTIIKLLRMGKRLEELLRDYDERILKQAIHSACLYGFALYQPNDAPPIKAVLDYDEYASLFSGENNKKEQDELIWSEALRVYGYHGPDSFDIAVFNGIKSGFYDEVKIKREAEILTYKHSINDQDSDFSRAWSIYHDSFENNAELFADELKKSIIKNAQAINPSNLSSSIKMLKRIGYAGDVDEVIKGYVDGRNDGREFWAGDNYSHPFGPDDPDVKAAFAAKALDFNEDRRLELVLADIARNRGWDHDTLPFIEKHSEEDFYKILKEARGDDLSYIARGLTFFLNIGNPSQVMKSINEKALAVFQRIGRESQINRIRVEKFGINVSDDP